MKCAITCEEGRERWPCPGIACDSHQSSFSLSAPTFGAASKTCPKVSGGRRGTILARFGRVRSLRPTRTRPLKSLRKPRCDILSSSSCGGVVRRTKVRLRRDNRICSENTRKTAKFHNIGFIENQETRRDRDHRKSKLRACNPAGVGGGGAWA